MKSRRPATSLHMLFALMDHGSFSEEEIMRDLELSRPSFFRALSDFRCYLQEYRPSEELCFDKETKRYRLRRYVAGT